MVRAYDVFGRNTVGPAIWIVAGAVGWMAHFNEKPGQVSKKGLVVRDIFLDGAVDLG